MERIRQNRPRVTTDAGFGKQGGDAIQKILPINIVVKNIAPLNFPYDYVLQETGNVKPG